MEYPYVSVTAIDVTDLEARASVEVRASATFTLPGVTEQDVVDAVKALFAQLPNVTVNAFRHEVTTSTA